MARTNRPMRPVSFFFLSLAGKLIIFLVAVLQLAANAEPIAIKFLPSSAEARAQVSPDKKLIVSVHTGSTQPSGAFWLHDGKPEKLNLLGQDQVTKLCFFENPRPANSSDRPWRKAFLSENPQELAAITRDGRITCRFDQWIGQVGDKVLPLALLKISVRSDLLNAGTPLVDSDNHIVGLVLQPASANAVYAIPAQAVHRVLHDITNHHELVRGWLGISLSTNSTIPRITRVWPGSPAAKADLRENDILIKAGPFSTNRYPEAVNALFYTIPGQATELEVLRDSKRISCKITPVAKKPGK